MTLKTKILAWILEGAWTGDGIRRKLVAQQIAVKITEVNMTKSWKTTLFGILGAVGAYLITVKDPTWAQNIGGILAAIGTAGMGLAARDNDKSSEDAGVK